MCKTCIRLVCESFTFFNKCTQSDEILNLVLSETKQEPSLETVTKEETENSDDNDTKTKPKRNCFKGQDAVQYFNESDDEHCLNELEDDSDWEPTAEDTKEVSVKLESECEDTQSDKCVSSDEDLEIKTEKS